MADPYVIFPGTSDHIATDDVNTLDADTAHLYQGLGGWTTSNQTGVNSWALGVGGATYSGGFVGGLTNAAGGLRLRNGTPTFDQIVAPVTPGVEYSFELGLYIDPGSPAVTEIFALRFTDGAGAAIDSDFPAAAAVGFTGWGVVSRSSYIAPAGAVSCQFEFRLDGFSGAGQVVRISDVCVRAGSVSEFVPSLRIVGSLYEETVPVDMPVVFAGDGTPLTVGEGWAGNGYSYARYDGPDASAPLVASFQAGDVPVAAQLPG